MTGVRRLGIRRLLSPSHRSLALIVHKVNFRHLELFSRPGNCVKSPPHPRSCYCTFLAYCQVQHEAHDITDIVSASLAREMFITDPPS